MDKIITWFKTTTFYYWFVLVIWASLKQAVSLSEIKEKGNEIIITLIGGFISIAVLGQVQGFPDLGLNLYSFVIWIVATFILRFLAGVFTTPAKLHREQHRLVNKYKWRPVEFRCVQFGENSEYGGYRLEIVNRKPFDIADFYVEILYLETDGQMRYKRPTHNYIQGTAHRFPHLESGSFDWHTITLEKEIGKAIIVLIDRVKRLDKNTFRILQYVPSKTTNQFEEMYLEFDKEARIEVVVLGRVENMLMEEECVFNFEAKIANEQLAVTLHRGRLSYYL